MRSPISHPAIHRTLLVGAIALLSTVAVQTLAPAWAQQAHGHGHGAAAQDHDEGPAVEAYIAAMERMHEAMSTMAYTGDADIDFARGMIPHHQAAIDMAQIVLEHGRDPQIRAMAQTIIEAQEAEIAELLAWLAEHHRD